MRKQQNQTQLNLLFIDQQSKSVGYVNFMVQSYNGTQWYQSSYDGKAVIYNIPLYQQVTIIVNMSGYDPLIQPLYMMSMNMSQTLVLRKQNGTTLEVVTYNMNKAMILPYVNFQLYQNGMVVGNYTTGYDGRCQIQNLSQYIQYYIYVNYPGF
jgi:hypothetical protein